MENFVSVTVISAEAALKAVSVAIAEGAKAGVKVSVAVVDPSLSLVAFGRADGATPHSAETSRRKANTASSTKRATGWMSGELAVALPMGTGNLLTNIGGGVPIRFGGTFGGGLGIAGGTVDQDVAVAKATLAALGADQVE